MTPHQGSQDMACHIGLIIEVSPVHAPPGAVNAVNQPGPDRSCSSCPSRGQGAKSSFVWRKAAGSSYAINCPLRVFAEKVTPMGSC